MHPSILRLLAILCSTAALASAQTRGDDPFGAASSDPKPKLSAFELEPGLLSDSVRALQAQLSGQGLDPVNVVLEPGTEGMATPELHFNAVTGHDALKLLAAAAGCQAEPILSDESGPSARIIGYKLRQPQQTSVTFTGPGGSPTTILNPALSTGAARVISAKAGTGGTDAAIIGGPAQATAARAASQVRIYPLATISSDVGLGEIQELVRSVLETSAIPQEDVRLMVHEKSNVLVVRAPEETQLIVEQLLESISENSAHDLESATKRQAEAAERNAAAMAAQNEILQQRLAAQAEEAAALRDELDSLRQQLQTQKQ